MGRSGTTEQTTRGVGADSTGERLRVTIAPVMVDVRRLHHVPLREKPTAEQLSALADSLIHPNSLTYILEMLRLYGLVDLAYRSDRDPKIIPVQNGASDQGSSYIVKYPFITGKREGAAIYNFPIDIYADVMFMLPADGTPARVWTRVGLPFSGDDSRGVPAAHRISVTGSMRQINRYIADQASQLVTRQLVTLNLQPSASEAPDIHTPNNVEIVSLGAEDPLLEAGIRLLDERDERASAVRFGNGVDQPRPAVDPQDLLSYIDQYFMGITDHRSDEDDDNFILRVPTVKRDGTTNRAIVRAKTQSRGNVRHIFAMCADDSRKGDLTFAAALRLAGQYDHFLKHSQAKRFSE